MIGPLLAAVSLKVSLIVLKAAFADWINCGKKMIFFSYCLPTISKAGINILLMISRPGVVLRSSLVVFTASSFKPCKTISFKLKFVVSFFVTGSWFDWCSI